MDWKRIMADAGIPESPGYAEAADPSNPMIAARRAERARWAEEHGRKSPAKGKPKPKPKGYK
jgi:hypothetical protein